MFRMTVIITMMLFHYYCLITPDPQVQGEPRLVGSPRRHVTPLLATLRVQKHFLTGMSGLAVAILIEAQEESS